MNTCPAYEKTLVQVENLLEPYKAILNQITSDNAALTAVKNLLSNSGLGKTLRESTDTFALYTNDHYGFLVEFSKGCSNSIYVLSTDKAMELLDILGKAL